MSKGTTNLRDVIGRALESAGWLNCDQEDWSEFCASLAAKDAEIAELRRTAADWAKAYAYLTDILPLDPRHFARDPACPLNLAEQDRHRVDVLIGERDAARAEIAEAGATIADMANTILRLTRERDEARECVRRLFAALAAFEDCADYDVKGQSLEDAARNEYAAMRAALAATPEHLRGDDACKAVKP